MIKLYNKGSDRMDDNLFSLLSVTYLIVMAGAVILAIYLIHRHQKKKYHTILTNLERDKNLIVSASIISELKKIENLINNDELQKIYDELQLRFREIKDVEVPKITDKLIEVDDFYEKRNYRELEKKLAKIELDIFYIKKRSEFLLNEIKDITSSEEKNRETVTKLKGSYRETFTKFNHNRDIYGIVINPIELQFETIDKLFGAFEISMDNKNINEIGKIVKALDDTIGNLRIVIDEAPSIIVMGKNIIPKKMAEIIDIHKKMIKENYNLDYINLEQNISEAEKKIADIFDRLKVLNLQDSIFDLKTMIDYFDSLYSDFEKEKKSKKIFDDLARTIGVKCTRLNKIIAELIKSINDLQNSYDLTSDELNIINILADEQKEINNDYDSIMNSFRSKSFAFTRLCKEMELINVRLNKTEDRLETTVVSFGSLKDDELRAKEQLTEIKDIFRQAKRKISSYKLPLVPKKYYVEMQETKEAIAEIEKELERRPISIQTLNTRVDTARDLVLKLYITSKEIIKSAYMAEVAIVYGNRYRSINKEVEIGLNKAEGYFFKGDYRSSLEDAMGAINIVEPGIHKKLLESYGK